MIISLQQNPSALRYAVAAVSVTAALYLAKPHLEKMLGATTEDAGDANPANALLSPSAVLPPASDGTTSRESQLESALRQLELNLATAREENRRKDLMITRYETWYRTLKANARKRSASDESKEAIGRRPGAVPG